MNPKIDSYLRHVFTGWIAAAVVVLTTWLTLDDATAKTVKDALEQIGAGLVILIVTLAPIIGRALWAWISSLFRRGAGEPGDTEKPAGPSGGAALLVIMTGTAAVIMGSLPSCAPGDRIPIRAKILTPGGAVSYSSKGGLTLEVDASSVK